MTDTNSFYEEKLYIFAPRQAESFSNTMSWQDRITD